MKPSAILPRPLQPFVQFAGTLRDNGFAVAPEQTENFIAGAGLLGPRSMEDIRRAAVATLAPPPERRAEFDALFKLVFLGQSVAAPASAEDDDEDLQAFDDRGGSAEPPEPDDVRESGGDAVMTETLSARMFSEAGESRALRQFRRQAAALLPRRRSRRRAAARSRGQPDLRRALREAVRRDGEVVQLPLRARRTRQRRIVLLIDISGSMKAQTDQHLRFAHALMKSAERLEVFTLGTRLTRISRAWKIRNGEQALARAATLVADWDGGTRLGDALQAFLDIPRFTGFARGAMVVVLSDGLERGDPSALLQSVTKLSRLAWDMLWLTPLAASGDATDADYRPQTRALQALLPSIGRLGGGGSTARICNEILQFSRRAA